MNFLRFIGLALVASAGGCTFSMHTPKCDLKFSIPEVVVVEGGYYRTYGYGGMSYPVQRIIPYSRSGYYGPGYYESRREIRREERPRQAPRPRQPVRQPNGRQTPPMEPPGFRNPYNQFLPGVPESNPLGRN